jgi:hypothetical protein
MADRVSEIVGKGLTQDSLPHRLKFEQMGPTTYKGYLSICALTFACFSEHDKPLEFILTINSRTGEAKVRTVPH